MSTYSSDMTLDCVAEDGQHVDVASSHVEQLIRIMTWRDTATGGEIELYFTENNALELAQSIARQLERLRNVR